MEDVGRHNAVDKVIGKGMMGGFDFTKGFLVATGRLSSDIVIKCARVGIPLVASKAASLESGISAADMTGLTIIGFLRGSRLNVYTGPQRVKM
jgi:formate dehydrogenase accessory protein FdhD